jgi:hypothetical protein
MVRGEGYINKVGDRDVGKKKKQSMDQRTGCN